MPGTTEIRPATVDDLDVLAELNGTIHELHRAALPAVFVRRDPSAVVDHYASALAAGQLLLVAEVGNRAVGFVHGESVTRPATAFQPALHLLFVHELVVADSARMQGVGRALMAAIEDEGRRSGASEVRLQHYAFNTGAHGFYAAAGYRTLLVTMQRPLG